MTKKYIKVPLSQAYRLLNSGYLVLIASYSKNKKYDITPIAWNCIVHRSPTRILLAIGQEHKTFQNIKETKKFVICIPGASQLELVKNTGSISGKNSDKFSKFKIRCFKGHKIKAWLPKDCIGYIECRLFKIYNQAEAALIIGESVYARALKSAFNKRILCENKEGRGLYHLGSGYFSVPSAKIHTF